MCFRKVLDICIRGVGRGVCSRIDLECCRVLMCLLLRMKKIVLPLTIAYLPEADRLYIVLISDKRGSTTHLRVHRLFLSLFLYLSTYFL